MKNRKVKFYVYIYPIRRAQRIVLYVEKNDGKYECEKAKIDNIIVEG